MGLSLINFEEGAGRFAGAVRGGDEAGHFVFELQIPTFPELYGEWNAIFEANKTDFGIEIVSFGYRIRENVGNPHPNARLKFSGEQRNIIQRLITALFSSAEAREGIPPFTSKKGRFSGRVEFRPGWIVAS
jgi:hypothetical protein